MLGARKKRVVEHTEHFIYPGGVWLCLSIILF